MGYAFVLSPCYSCKQPFSYNPHLVPSLSILNGRAVPAGTPGAVKEPFCADCISKANPVRIKNGLTPIIPHPHAYEPIPEELL
jgi:hypothetical protein